VEAPARFEIDRVYGRADLLDEYGGQRYGGIITPAAHPLVFIVTGSAGLKYGYHDRWDDDGVFHYYGEGQAGPMRFTGGNAAIRDHAKNEEELHLFERVRPKVLRYRGEMACSGYEWITDEDVNGDQRKAIVFQLVPIGNAEIVDGASSLAGASLKELARLADEDPTEEQTPKEGRRKTYARSAALKAYVRARANGICEGCDSSAPFESSSGPYLETHHTLRRSDSGPGRRVTVIGLCPNCHARVHFGLDGAAYNEELKTKLIHIEVAGERR
jgi:5-methylcytosine-specific restriction enzyme A